MDIKNFDELKKLEDKTTSLRKQAIIYKMEEYYEYAGIEGGDCFMDYLKENCNFKYGDVIDFELFKKEFLTDTFRLSQFIEEYVNTAFDYDEFVFLGFGDDLSVVNQTEVYDTYYSKIMNYEFSNKDLALFEDFVDSKYKEVFNWRA
ncbi:MAG: hypothetical protein IKG40_01255 [Bacilli bacterium]|nr:hypothetical protein [Bacilli bacterium]